ncbi:MAG: FtsX-like permease family protein, partial [Acidobacteria bacterium]|nr:FtsX-like permease family protein [Acidobacteriota bacterium]
AVYGVDAQFFAFHGVAVDPPTGSAVYLSPDLAAELDAKESDSLVLRVARPTDIPMDSLHGRKEDIGRSTRLTVLGTLSTDQQGEFSLAPSQGPVRAIFVSLARLQRDLSQAGKVNALLVSRAAGQPLSTATLTEALTASLTNDDLGLSFTTLNNTLHVETASGLIGDALANVLSGIATRQQLERTDLLTWLANTMTSGTRSVPYSLVVGVGPSADGDTRLAAYLRDDGQGAPPVVLNEWAAKDLGISVGAPVDLEYYRWADEGRLVTERASFRVTGVVPIEGFAADRRLAPAYPGITDADSVGDWDPPFPMNLALVRPIDEDYWDRYRTTAKAFIPIEVAQELWQSKHGRITAMRLRSTDGRVLSPDQVPQVGPALGPVRAGLTVVDVRAQNAAASTGATDFGAYFSYFSFFLVVSALLLTALFFRLGIEQRLREIGVLRAAGFGVAHVQRLFLMEGLWVAIAGALAGVGLAVAWGALMMHGLRTWWVGAVGTTALRLHIDPVTLIAGGIGGVLTALACIWLSVRAIRRYSPRELLSGSTDSALTAAPSRLTRTWPVMLSLLAIALAAAGLGQFIPPAAAFFGAGALVLIAGLVALNLRLRRTATGALSGAGTLALMRFGWHNARWRPGRSLTSVALVAVAAFLLVSVDAFRKDTTAALAPTGGTGGYALMAETVLPLVHDPSTPDGREALGLQFEPTEPLFTRASILAARLRPGDDASCLNLYQPKQPRIVGVSNAFIEAGRFRFAASVAESDSDRVNPWGLLTQPSADGIVPAIVDATSLQYVLHASVGDVITVDADTARPIRLRIVASLADSVLQGEIVIAESAFVALFPEIPGYRVLFVEADPATVAEAETTIEERLEPFGADVQSSVRRLEAYHRVENTYLSTFQALGGLGLVLGTIGLAAITARNVLERRREMALLSAAGYRVKDLSIMVVAENLWLVLAGVGVGVAAALVAIAPVLIERGGRPPALSMIWLLAVVIAGLAASLVATRAVRRLPLLASLRSE